MLFHSLFYIDFSGLEMYNLEKQGRSETLAILGIWRSPVLLPGRAAAEGLYFYFPAPAFVPASTENQSKEVS